MPSDRVEEIKRKIDANASVSANDLKALFEEATKRGAVHAILHFDAYGKSEDEVKKAHVHFLGELTKEPGMLYCKGKMESVTEKEGLYSTVSEAEVLLDSLLNLQRATLRYGPAAVEILSPQRFTLENEDVHALLVQSSEFAQAYAKVFMERAMKDNAQKVEEHAKKREDEGARMLDDAKSEEKA